MRDHRRAKREHPTKAAANAIVEGSRRSSGDFSAPVLVREFGAVSDYPIIDRNDNPAAGD